MPKTYYNAQIYPNHSLVHIPQAAIEAYARGILGIEASEDSVEVTNG